MLFRSPVGGLAFGIAIAMLATSFATTAHSETPAQAQVTMPLRCSVEHGRIVLAPSPERSYRIVGPHRHHAFTACAPGQPDRCRTWMIHRFEMLCGATRVPWAAVVAAANERPPRRVLFNGGRLHIALGPAWRPPAYRDPGRPGDIYAVALPPGYAPVVGLAARFSPAAGGPETRVSEVPRPRRAVAGDGRPQEVQG